MVQLGKCVQQLIATLATTVTNKTPFKLPKLDIKYGFWRLEASEKDAWNFCYVLPQVEKVKTIEDIELVVQNCLQMGWCESPPFFCASSETAIYVIDTLLDEVKLTYKPFEEQIIAYKTDNPRHRIKESVTNTNTFDFFATRHCHTSHMS